MTTREITEIVLILIIFLWGFIPIVMGSSIMPAKTDASTGKSVKKPQKPLPIKASDFFYLPFVIPELHLIFALL